MQQVDAVVVGGGIMGSASAWSLARRGRSVVMLEQFEVGHTRGSSHGGSRIFRLAYPDPWWVTLARGAQGEWERLAAESGIRLVTPTGSVDHGDPDGVRAIADALTAAETPFEMLDASEAAQRWPGMRFDGPVLHQPDGGRIDAARAWEALIVQLQRHGGHARWRAPARAIETVGDRARVVTDDETYDAPVVVVAGGAWLADGLVPEMELQLPELVVTQESAFHFTPRAPEPWPSFIHHGATFVYGLETPGEGVKVAEHHTGPVVTAETRDFVVDATARERITAFVDGWLPGLEPQPVSEVTCLYTSTANEDFVVDREGPVIVVSPCSGHGFKFAPLIGHLAADLADGAPGEPRFASPRAPAR